MTSILRRRIPAPRIRLTVAAALVSILAVLAPLLVAAPAEAQAPPGSVKHTDGRYWAWFAPRGWIAAYGTYGITIIGPSGRDILDLGFSSVLCAPATTAAGSAVRFLGNQRAQILARSGLRRQRVLQATIVQLPPSQWGPNYFRATTVFRGNTRRGLSLTVAMTNDYAVTDPTYCYNRNVALQTPTRTARAGLLRLRQIQSTLAYFGPGVCDPQIEECPPTTKP